MLSTKFKVQLEEENFDLMKTLIKSIEELIECPILLVPIDKPVILPSGNTVDEKVVLELIDKNKTDPFSNQKISEDIIENRLFYAIKEIYEDLCACWINTDSNNLKADSNKINELSITENNIEILERLNFDLTQKNIKLEYQLNHKNIETKPSILPETKSRSDSISDQAEVIKDLNSKIDSLKAENSSLSLKLSKTTKKLDKLTKKFTSVFN